MNYNIHVMVLAGDVNITLREELQNKLDIWRSSPIIADSDFLFNDEQDQKKSD